MTFAIRPTDPCPCGSGKPYEQCCGRDVDSKPPHSEAQKNDHREESHGCGCGH